MELFLDVVGEVLDGVVLVVDEVHVAVERGREVDECERGREVGEFGGREIVLGFRIGALVLSETGNRTSTLVFI